MKPTVKVAPAPGALVLLVALLAHAPSPCPSSRPSPPWFAHLSSFLMAEARACDPRDLHENPTPAEMVVLGRVTEAQFHEQHDEEPVWVTQAYMRTDIESCTSLGDAECLGTGEHKLRHDGRQQFLIGERVALVLFRRPDTGEPQILYHFTLSDQDGDGDDEVYRWRRGDLLANPAPEEANHLWADNLQWNYAPGETPPPAITWEEVLFDAFRDAPPQALAAEALPVQVHDSLNGLLEWVIARNLELER